LAAAWAIDLLRERCGSWAQKNPLRPQRWSQQGVNVYGRHCRAPQRQGFTERYPRMSCESIIAAATAPTVTPASWLAVACAQRCECAKARAQESLLVGANGYHDFKRRNVQPIVGLLRRRPYADRHSMLRLSHECTARLPGSPALKKERIRPNRVCRLLQDLELAASAE
jgi:hypothetical protein